MAAVGIKQLFYAVTALVVVVMACIGAYNIGKAQYYDEAVLWRQRAFILFRLYDQCVNSPATD